MRDVEPPVVLDVPRARRAAGLTRRAAMVISTRYHPIVFGLSAGVPCLGIYTDEYTRVKIVGALGHAGLQNWAISMVEGLAGELSERVRRLSARRDGVREIIGARRQIWAQMDLRRRQRMCEALGLSRPDDPPAPPATVDPETKHP
jgi:polysaccharide pyruvyl transferase WcaK-like protein